MARKKKHEEHENHERWLVSYADFITLLFAFFVVMYSVSSVNEGKYRVLSESLNAAFSDPTRSMDPVQVGQISRTTYSIEKLQRTSPVDLQMPGLPLPRLRGGEAGQARGKAAGAALEQVSKELRHAMSSLIDQGMIKVSGNETQVEVEINTEILFHSGSATLAPGSIPVLQAVAGILQPFPNDILVEGHTDSIPVSGGRYESNWELSASRSASVVRLFAASGIAPIRLAATGYGEYRPIADNETVEGRSKNRRVVLVIPAVKPGSAIHKGLSDAKIQGMSRISEIKEWVPQRDVVSPARDTSLSPFIAPVQESAPAPTGSAGKVPVLLPPAELPRIPSKRKGLYNAGAVNRPAAIEIMPGAPAIIPMPIQPFVELGPKRDKIPVQKSRAITQQAPGSVVPEDSAPEIRPTADTTLQRDLGLSGAAPLSRAPVAATGAASVTPAGNAASAANGERTSNAAAGTPAVVKRHKSPANIIAPPIGSPVPPPANTGGQP